MSPPHAQFFVLTTALVVIPSNSLTTASPRLNAILTETPVLIRTDPHLETIIGTQQPSLASILLYADFLVAFVADYMLWVAHDLILYCLLLLFLDVGVVGTAVYLEMIKCSSVKSAPMCKC